MMLTPLELDVMKAVWRDAPIAVRDVQSALRPSRILAYTTVMTIMDRLYHKGFLTRRIESRAHLYEPVISYAAVRDDALNVLIESFFEGSHEKLREFLSGNGQATGRSGSHHVMGPSSLDETLL